MLVEATVLITGKQQLRLCTYTPEYRGGIFGPYTERWPSQNMRPHLEKRQGLKMGMKWQRNGHFCEKRKAMGICNRRIGAERRW